MLPSGPTIVPCSLLNRDRSTVSMETSAAASKSVTSRNSRVAHVCGSQLKLFFGEETVATVRFEMLGAAAKCLVLNSL